jgi:hypothetical protein
MFLYILKKSSHKNKNNYTYCPSPRSVVKEKNKITINLLLVAPDY